MKKGAIFDMDGLMFDTERLYGESWMVMAEQFGQVPDPEFHKAAAGTAGETMRALIHRYYPDVDAQQLMDAVYHRVQALTAVEIPEKPGLRKILKGLKAHGLKLAVASSSPQATIERNLRTAGVMEYFDAVVSSIHPDIKDGKPSPDVFLFAARQIGIPPEDCYVFEDSLNGIRAGYAAGAVSVMIPDTMEPTEEIRRLCHVFPDLGAAMDAIEAGEL